MACGVTNSRTPKRPFGAYCSYAIKIISIGVGLIATAPHRALAESIESALARAYENNPQLNAQRAVVRQADESVAQAMSGYRPSISANASVGKEHSLLQETFPPIPGTPLTQSETATVKGPTTPRSLGATASQTLFNGEMTANKVRSAESDVNAARETLRLMEQTVLLAAATAYMDVLRDTANLEVQRSNFSVLQRMFNDTHMRFEVGQITDTDVSQAEAQLAAGEASVAAAESTLVTTRANYRRIIGVDPTKLSPASTVEALSPSTLSAAVTVAATQNPSVTAALYGVDVAVLQVKIAEGALWPDLTAQASVERSWDTNIVTPKLFTQSATLNLSVPLYQGGGEYSAIRRSKEAVGQQRLTVDQIRDQVQAEVVGDWAQMRAARVQISAATRQGVAAEKALSGVRKEAMIGQRTTLDVLNSQQALVNARISLINAQHDGVVASYNLLSAVGRLSAQTLGLPVTAYDPSVHYHQVRDSWFGLRTPSGQ